MGREILLNMACTLINTDKLVGPSVIRGQGFLAKIAEKVPTGILLYERELYATQAGG